MTAFEEAALTFGAVDYLRARGTRVTPEKVESYVRERAATNGQLLPRASVREITMAVHALGEQHHLNEKGHIPMGDKVEFAAVNREGKNMGVLEGERIGPTPPAQQYAEPQDYFAEPRVSPSKRAELEAEAAGLRTEMQSPGLTETQKIRLEQALVAIERTLGKSGSDDARRTFAR